MSDGSAEGGCLCGAIRYRVTGEPVAATLCHCRSCRRASGGTNVAWAVFEEDKFEWLWGSPTAYSSSPGLEWLFCSFCGSTVGYRRASRPNHMDITTATLDEPSIYPPTVEIWLEQRVGWETLHPDIPKKQQSSLNVTE
jgi:hypothetical protein